MKAKNLKELSTEELQDKYRGFKDELFNLRFQLATGQLEKFSRVRQVRKDIARVLTIMYQKEKGIGLNAGGNR